METSDIVRQL